jgi:hypothetical protein
MTERQGLTGQKELPDTGIEPVTFAFQYILKIQVQRSTPKLNGPTVLANFVGRFYCLLRPKVAK